MYELQRLQEKAERRNAVIEVGKQEKAEVDDLQAKVDQLKERRNKLRKRLNNGPHEILQKYLKKSKGQSSRKDIVTGTSNKAIITAVRMLQKHKLTDLCDTYRLTGISIASQEAKRTCFRCETFFNSRYREPYYIEVELKDNSLKICKHTVPYFIPVDSICQQYLNSDIKKFFMVISQHLNAFVARREQVHLCQELHREKLEGEISCSPAHDFVQFKPKLTEGQNEDVVVKLNYDSPTKRLPSSVEYLHEGRKTSASWRIFLAKKKFFKELYLHLAFSKAFTQDCA